MTAALAVAAVLAMLAVVKTLERRLAPIVVRAGIAVFVLGPLLGLAFAMWALWRRSLAPVDLALLAGLAVVTGLGTSFGYHRLLTHRSFRTTPWITAAALAAPWPSPAARSTGPHAISSTTPTRIATGTLTAPSTACCTHTSAGSSRSARPSASDTAAG